jgi:hypothetical protein
MTKRNGRGTAIIEAAAEAVRQMELPAMQGRAVSPKDLQDLMTVAKALQKAQRRYNAVTFRIADAYDIEQNEMIDPNTGLIVPIPQNAR